MPVKEETEMSSSQSDDGKIKQKSEFSLYEDTKCDGCRIIIEPPQKIQIKEGEDIKICCNILGKNYIIS